MSGLKSKIERIKNGKPYSIFDIVAILLALIVSLSYIIYTLAVREQGAEVVVSVNKGGTYYFSLQEDRVIDESDIDLEKGRIRIVIAGGAVYVSFSDCDNQICLHMGKKMYKGESITCLPLGVHIRIGGALNLVVG